MTANTLTAHEFHAQGTTPAQVLSVAKAQTDSTAYHALRDTAHELARMTGVRLHGRKRKAGNDNRPQRKQWRAA